ncbi:hypothetical protein ACFCX0_03565 [Streptomyces sp. NPDC056352]|uniref:hypothetical protein n=1 Tax=Streptomyces sp. NPDC056352 TaxID=3345791 RepID=UPI0035DBE54C
MAVTAEPLRFCADHEKEAASRLGPLAGALEVELYLNSSTSTRYRRFGNAIAPPPKISRHRPVVYYMQRERGGLIKIGTSTRLRKRSQELDAEVLAAEPGSEPEERQRQRQFKHLHHHHEWFRPGDDLMAHMAELVKRYGQPVLV